MGILSSKIFKIINVTPSSLVVEGVFLHITRYVVTVFKVFRYEYTFLFIIIVKRKLNLKIFKENSEYYC